jgi:Cu(I)/Ag(I) efflux system membrane fusion protein
VAYITARVAGRVDRLYADFNGIQVRAGEHLADVYSPELYTAQSELFLALDSSEKAQSGQRTLAGDFARGNLEAARTKLRLWGITPEQLAEIENSRKTRTHLTIYAPIGGTVIEKAVREGQYVKEGDLLYRVADPDPIWLYLDIYEYDLGWVGYGQAVDVTVEAYPGETFHGKVTFIDPFLDDRTRAVKVRVNLPNQDRRLKPAMYASAVIRVRVSGDGSPEPTRLEGKFWCPMHPEVVSDQPGRCPICQMPL